MMLFPKPEPRRKGRKVPTIGGIGTTMSALRTFVQRRDRSCLAWRFDPEHQCRDEFGTPHAPSDWWRLTLEHVPMVHSLTDPRRDDEAHTVAMCSAANVGGPSTELRTFCRGWLANLYPGHVD